MKRMSREELMEAALDRIQAKWPDIDRDVERTAMQNWDDWRLATAYIEADDPETHEELYKLYDRPDPRYDSADEGGLVGGDLLG